jgi:bacterioferritin (cytochrome b1)
MPSDDEMDTPKVLETLQHALNMQAESILTMSMLAGTLRGVGGAAVKQSLRTFVLAELEDTYLLVEKMSALGGTPSMSARSVEVSCDADEALGVLLRHEVETVGALHAVIPHSGQEPRSEALEHLLEHLIMRKQQQIDFLWHASNQEEPLA